jgi:hypothetical protein
MGSATAGQPAIGGRSANVHRLFVHNVEEVMGDTKHPGIQQSLKEAKSRFDVYDDVATRIANRDFTLAVAIKTMSQVPGADKDKYQTQFNETLLVVIEDVASMITNLAGVVEHLKNAVDLIAKEMPPPRRATDSLFDSRH